MPKENHKILRGVISPVVTPFTQDFFIDESLLNEFGAHLLSDGCVGLLLFGTTGEALSVSPSMRISALRNMVASGISADRLMFGAGLCDLSGSVELCQAACDVGCHSVMMLPPFYYKGVSDDGLFAYFETLIRAVDRDNLRIYLYHIPQVCGVGFSNSLVRRLYDAFPQVVGIKDSSGDAGNLQALLGIDGLVVYPGSELFLLDALKGGGAGCITASANLNSVDLGRVVELYDAGGDYEAVFGSVSEFRQVIQGYPLVPALKGLLALDDGRWGNIGLPLELLDGEQAQKLKEKLKL